MNWSTLTWVTLRHHKKNENPSVLNQKRQAKPNLPDPVEYDPATHLLQMVALEAPVKHLKLKTALMA